MKYDELLDLPKLNGVTILDDKTLEEYGLCPMTQEEVEEIQLEIMGTVMS